MKWHYRLWRAATKTACLCLLLAAPLAAPPAQAIGRDGIPLTPEIEARLGQISAWLNGFTHLEGEFSQTNPSGSLREGKFYIRRPWRMRFAYNPPHELLVVADGRWLAVREAKDQPVQRYPLASTPARFLLMPNVDLAKQVRVLGFARLPGEIRLVLADKDKEIPGTLALHFRTDPLTLSSWSVVGAQGQQTRVDLRNLRRGIKANNELFLLEDYDPFNPKK